jgi:hypothetical protein
MHSSPNAPRRSLAILLALFRLRACLGHAAETCTPARVAVYFSPHGGVTDAPGIQ